MEFIYNTLAFQNYGIAILIFTVFVRLLMLPLNMKQQTSLVRQQALMPEIEAIKKQYKDDPKKAQEEQMALFSKHQINPYSGCLPMLIQYPLILVVYQIIRRPLTYISGLSASAIKALAEISGKAAANEIEINNFFLSNLGKLAEGVKAEQLINMKFLKIFDLGVTPSWKFWNYGADWKIYVPLLMIPLLATLTAYLQQAVSMSLTNGGKKKDQQDASAGAMNGMLKVMPLISLVFAFILPAGVGLYWAIGNLVGIGQTYLIKKVVVPKKKEGSV